MKRLILAALSFISITVSAQTFTVTNSLINQQSFVYRFINQQYITNENNFFLDMDADTMYLHFDKQFGRVFKMTIWRDKNKVTPYKGLDTTLSMEYIWQFNDSGKIINLLNHSDFANVIKPFYDNLYEKRQIGDFDYQEILNMLNNPMSVASHINSNFTQLFSIASDTFNLDNKYLRLKNLQSPISKMLIPVMGTLETMVINDKPLVYSIHAQNRADSTIKTLLVDELLAYTKKLDPKNFAENKEINKVGLNAEQNWVWNSKKQMFTRIEFGDVFVINNQSRGNIRIFELWQYSEN